MNGMLLVVRRELLSRPRRGWFHLKRMGIVAFGGVNVLLGLLSANASSGAASGLALFSWLAYASLFAMCPIGLVTAASSIMTEKEDRTLGLLLITDITLFQLAAGKFLVSLFAVTVSLVSLIPMLMLAMSLGGIAADQILAALAIIGCSAFLAVSMGLFAGAVASGENGMRSLLALLGIVVFIAPWPVCGLLDEVWEFRWAKDVCELIWPVMTMENALRTGMSDVVVGNCVLFLALGLIFLLLVVSVLHRKRAELDTPAESTGLLAWLKTVWRGSHRNRAVRGNPVAWRELHIVYTGLRTTWILYVLLVSLCFLVMLLIKLKVGHDWELGDMAKTAVVVVFCLSALVLGLLSVARFGAAFNKEKRQRTLGILLTTDLTDVEIIRGKVWGVMRSLTPWLVSTVVTAVAIFAYAANTVYDDYQKYPYAEEVKALFIIPSILAIEYLAKWICFSSLALWLSLRCKRNVAFAVCVVAVVLWHTIGWTLQGMLLALLSQVFSVGSFNEFLFMVAVWVTIDVVIAAGITVGSLWALFTSFRTSALRNAE